MSILPPADWVPMRVYQQDTELLVDTCAINWNQLIEPFFEQTLERELRQPFNALFRAQVPLAQVAEQEQQNPSPPPAGLIFHMSRCGSTLLSRLLQFSPGCRMIAEPGAITMLLRQTAEHPLAVRVLLLRGLVGMFGRVAAPDQPPRLFLKLDSWQTCDLALFRLAFPATPWIFVTRDPLEILVSQINNPASAMLTRSEGAAQIGLDPSVALTQSIEEFCARALGCYCQIARQQLDSQGLVIDYAQLPGAAFELLPQWFGLEWTAQNQVHLRRLTRFHAKHPAEMFDDDSARKRAVATDWMRAATDQWARPSYEALTIATKAGKA